jgi:hypothetical protein
MVLLPKSRNFLDYGALADAPRARVLSAILWESHRDAMPLRRSFLQSQDGHHQPGTAALFVTQRRERALDLFLLLHALSSSAPHAETLPVEVWAPLIGSEDARRSSVHDQFRKNLYWLNEQNFVRITRDDREAPTVELLREGSGTSPYEHPAATGDSYLTLPHTYWKHGWDRRLDLPAKVVLLIARSLRPGFLLPGQQAAEWYGVSAPTIQRGLASLRQHRLLWTTFEQRAAPRSPVGYRTERRHTLIGPFSRDTPAAPTGTPE